MRDGSELDELDKAALQASHRFGRHGRHPVVDGVVEGGL